MLRHNFGTSSEEPAQILPTKFVHPEGRNATIIIDSMKNMTIDSQAKAQPARSALGEVSNTPKPKPSSRFIPVYNDELLGKVTVAFEKLFQSPSQAQLPPPLRQAQTESSPDVSDFEEDIIPTDLDFFEYGQTNRLFTDQQFVYSGKSGKDQEVIDYGEPEIPRHVNPQDEEICGTEGYYEYIVPGTQALDQVEPDLLAPEFMTVDPNENLTDYYATRPDPYDRIMMDTMIRADPEPPALEPPMVNWWELAQNPFDFTDSEGEFEMEDSLVDN